MWRHASSVSITKKPASPPVTARGLRLGSSGAADPWRCLSSTGTPVPVGAAWRLRPCWCACHQLAPPCQLRGVAIGFARRCRPCVSPVSTGTPVPVAQRRRCAHGAPGINWHPHASWRGVAIGFARRCASGCARYQLAPPCQLRGVALRPMLVRLSSTDAPASVGRNRASALPPRRGTTR